MEKTILKTIAPRAESRCVVPSKEDKAKYDMEYAKKNLKRIPLDVQKEKYDEIATAANKAGKSVNGYIKTAIDEKMERDKQ